VEQPVERWATSCQCARPHPLPPTTSTHPPRKRIFLILSTIWSRHGYRRTPDDAKKTRYAEKTSDDSEKKRMLASQRYCRRSPRPPFSPPSQARVQLQPWPPHRQDPREAHIRLRRCHPRKRRSHRIRLPYARMQLFKFSVSGDVDGTTIQLWSKLPRQKQLIQLRMFLTLETQSPRAHTGYSSRYRKDCGASFGRSAKTH